jgi:hypothetical protein
VVLMVLGAQVPLPQLVTAHSLQEGWWQSTETQDDVN